LIGVGALSLAAAQPPAAPAGPRVIDMQKLKDNLYVLTTSTPGNPATFSGGNVAVFITDGGVTLVDTKLNGWGQAVLDKVKSVTDKPITTIINTHTHGDHTGNNGFFGANVEVVAHENTKTNMEKMDIFKQNNNRGMAKRTFKDKMTIGNGADQVDLYYFGPGHTNGDAWVVFPAHRIVHSGDIFANKGVPLIDGNNGGSMLHYSETLMKAYNGIKNVDTIINGHTPANTTWADLKEFADFNKDLLTWAQGELKAGKTPEQAAAEWKLPEQYKDKGYSANVSPLMGGMPGRIATLQKEMKK
jgi:cyclase